MLANFIEGLQELKRLGATNYSFEHDVMYVYGAWNFPEPWKRGELDYIGELGFHWDLSNEHFYTHS